MCCSPDAHAASPLLSDSMLFDRDDEQSEEEDDDSDVSMDGWDISLQLAFFYHIIFQYFLFPSLHYVFYTDNRHFTQYAFHLILAE